MSLDPSVPLKITGLNVSYGETPVLRDIDLDVPAGAMLAVIGPNGAGKSTLIKAALGLVPRLAGQVAVFGQDVAAARGRIAYVPQRASVDWEFPATVLDVVLMGLYRELGLLGRATARHRARAMACLTRVGMQDFANRQIGRLSGGQQQRVFLARALAQGAALYILDEPFAGVDAATERAIIDVLKSLQAEGATVVCVHHDLATVQTYFTHVFLVNGAGVAQGPVAEAFTADNLQRAYGGRLTAAQAAVALPDGTGPDAFGAPFDGGAGS